MSVSLLAEERQRRSRHPLHRLLSGFKMVGGQQRQGNRARVQRQYRFAKPDTGGQQQSRRSPSSPGAVVSSSSYSQQEVVAVVRWRILAGLFQFRMVVDSDPRP